MQVTPEFLDAAFEARDALLTPGAEFARRECAGRKLRDQLDKLFKEQVEPLLRTPPPNPSDTH